LTPVERLAGKAASLWVDTAPERIYPSLTADLGADVAVVGAGITGVTAALLLARSGAKVALIDAGKVGAGVTGFSTAKVSSLHGLTYHGLISSVGEDTARAYGEANEAGLARIARWVEELGIDCDFRRKPNFTYTEERSERGRIESEVVAATKLGLPAFYTETSDLPFAVAAAVRLDDQAELHPVKYVLALAEAAERAGVRVFENTRAISAHDGSPCVVQTENGARLRADHVIAATHFPFLDRGLFFARIHPERSYLLAARIRGDLPHGMFLSTEQPAHSLRTAPREGGELLLVGGGSHKTGQADTAERYRGLEAYARERFDVESIDYRWATQDNMPVDGLPFIGRMWPFSGRILTATGYRKWGLAIGTSAGALLSDLVQGRPNAWAGPFDTKRLNLRASATDLAKENVNVALRFFGDRLAKRGGSARDLAPGEGRIVGNGPRQVAAYRDDAGRLHGVAARCTHLGCIVAWNGGDRTWDCPCHGSRFAHDGRVLHGPAVKPLEQRSLDE